MDKGAIMHKVTDQEVMEKVRGLEKDLGPEREKYMAFRERYIRYLYERGPRPEAEKKVCKPYIKYFPEK